MERICKKCDRSFSTPFSLRRHCLQFHPLDSQPKLLRMRRSKIKDQVNINQYGRGDISSGNDSDSEGNEDEKEGGDIFGNESESSSGDESGGEDEGEVFKFLVRLAKADLEEDENHEVSHEFIQEKFRNTLIGFLLWKDRLYKNPIYRKVMANVKELQDEEFDRREAIEKAVHDRRFLLKRVVPDPADDSDYMDTDGEQDEEGGAVGDSDGSDERDYDSDETS